MIKFETINGTLCRMVEPTPLTEKSLTHYTPCAIRPIKDNTQIGKLNKRTIYGGLSNCDGVYILNERQIGTGSYKNMIYAPWGSAHNFEQFEIIGYPVAEGSHWWALWAMMEGHDVCNPDIHGGAERFAVRDGIIVHHVRNAFENYCAVDSQFFPPAGLSTGWQLYKEPESPVDPKERPLRNLIIQAKEEGKNIRSFYQNLIFTPNTLTDLLANNTFRWWDIGNWVLTDEEPNTHIVRKLKLVSSEPEPPREPDYVICKRCGGSKSIANPAVSNTSYTTCPKCGGTGYEINPETAKEPIADCDNCKHRCPKRYIDHCQMYEPKPTYQVGDWVEVECQNKPYHKQVLFVTENRVGFEFSGTTPSVCFDGTPSHIFKFIRKLKASEVIISIGCLRRIIRYCLSFDNDGAKHDAIKIFNSNGKSIAVIHLEALDKETRKLVEGLLNAQEDNNG